MQKKILFSIMAILMLLVAVGCGPFNTEAKVTYASNTVTGTNIADKMIKITVTLGNSVYIDSIDEVNATVNDVAYKLKFINSKLDNTNKVINVYAFKTSTGAAIETKTSNSIEITSIKCTDENDNSVSVSGIELMGAVTISSSGTTTGDTTTALTAVKNISAVVSGTKIKVTWDAHSNATAGYVVYKSEMTGDNPVFSGTDTAIPGQVVNGIVLTTSMSYYEDTNVTTGNTYSYRVVAVSTLDVKTPKQDIPTYAKYSYTNTTTTVTVTIPAPTGITTAEDTSGISLSWGKVTVSGKNILGYNIYASDNYSDLDVTKDLTNYLVGSTPTVELGLLKLITVNDKYGSTNFTTGKNYYFRIAAVTEDKTVGEKSELVKGYIYNAAAPIIQKEELVYSLGTYNDSVSGKSISGVKFDWTRFSETGKDIKEYRLYKASNSNGPFTYKATIPVGTKIYVDSVEPGSTSYYAISCVTNVGGEGKKSGAVPVIDNGAPAIIDTSLISVTAVNDRDNEKAGNPDRRFIVSWGGYSAPADIAGYKIYMSKATLKDVDGVRLPDDNMTFAFMEGSNNGWKLIADVGYNINVPVDPTNQFTFNTSTSTGHYYLKITAYDVLGNESQPSLYKLVYNITPKVLKANMPTPVVTAIATGYKVTISGESGATYNLYRNGTLIGTIAAGGSYSDADGKAGNTYGVKMKYTYGTTSEMSNTTVAP